jgi:hypothetical protein
MSNGAGASDATGETQRILLFRSAAGGEFKGTPNRIAVMSPLVLSTCGALGSGSEKPPRAQTGSTPVWITDLQLAPAATVLEVSLSSWFKIAVPAAARLRMPAAARAVAVCLRRRRRRPRSRPTVTRSATGGVSVSTLARIAVASWSSKSIAFLRCRSRGGLAR